MGPADARGFSPSGAQAPAVAGVQEQGRQLCRYFSLRTERPSELSWGSWGAGGASRAAFSAATRAGGPGHRSSPQLFPLLVVSPSLNPAPISTPHKHPCFSVCARPVLGSGDTAGEGCLWLQPSRTLAGGHRGDQLPAAGEALWGPWEGLGPPSPPPTPALGSSSGVLTLVSQQHRGDPAQGLLGGQGTPAPRPAGAPPCLPPSASPGLTPFSLEAPAPHQVREPLWLWQAQPGRPFLGSSQRRCPSRAFLCLWTEPPFPPPPLMVHLSLQQPLDLRGQRGRAEGACTSVPEPQ